MTYKLPANPPNWIIG